MSTPLDPAAFWAEAHREAMLAACLRLRLTYAEAEDAVQDAMIRLIGARIDHDRNPRAFAIRTATRKALDVLRHRGRSREVEYVDELDALLDEPREMDPDYAERVRRAVADAPAQYGEAIRLLSEDLSYQEIAERTGAPIGTVRSRIHRGRQLLAPLLSAA